MIKDNCMLFVKEHNICEGLSNLVCKDKECKFYTTKEEYELKKQRAEERLIEIGQKTFRTQKGEYYKWIK